MRSCTWFLCILLFPMVVHADPLTQKIEALRATQSVPALGAMLITDRVPIRSVMTGFRKWGDPTPANLDDPFHLGSCTKAMTATLFAVLVEQGKVSWDSTLGALFPEIHNMNEAYRSVTVSMLLAHMSGLSDELFNREDFMKKISDPKISPSTARQWVAVEFLSTQPKTNPGSKWDYSNAGYIIVGRIIEKVSGQTWENFMREKIFRPLIMKSCGFGAAGNPRASTPDAPWGHQWKDQIPVPIPPGPLADNPPVFGPTGSVHCSMADWGKFLSMHLDGLNRKKTMILKNESFQKLHQNYPGQTYTYGGWVREQYAWAGGVVLAHEGSNTMNKSVVILAPMKNSALISVANIRPGSSSKENVTQQAWMELLKELK
jgi:CubicO group peptidase (beta-lactamase class C family)